MKKLLIIAYLISLSLISGCVDRFQISGADDLSKILVVEGAITQGESVVKLSRSYGLTEIITSSRPVSNALVSVECENGNIFEYSEDGNGTYRINIPYLDTNLQYRLFIKDGLREYRSEYLEPLQTPEIDNISFIKKERAEPVVIQAEFDVAGNDNRFFRWTYDEIWEIKTPIIPIHGYDENGLLFTYNDTFPYTKQYCWVYSTKNELLLSEQIGENVPVIKTLTQISPSSDKFSELYYIEVKLNSLRKESYDYFTNMIKNSTGTVTIFTPVPSELNGNIKCTTHPNEPVIGHIDVSFASTLEKFIFSPNEYYESYPGDDCPPCVMERDDFCMLFVYSPDGVVGFPNWCMDCTIKGSKIKPDFWPNDHE